MRGNQRVALRCCANAGSIPVCTGQLCLAGGANAVSKQGSNVISLSPGVKGNPAPDAGWVYPAQGRTVGIGCPPGGCRQGSMAVNPSFDERASPYGLRANAFPADTAIVGNRHACFEKRLSLAGVAWRQVAKQNYRQGNLLRAGAGLGRACAGVLSLRVRGKRRVGRLHLDLPRSIPACAGEPGAAPALPPAVMVYPRVCGGCQR